MRQIIDECAKQSYETASKGMIVSETGLHEDVFALRDRVSYGAIGYGLDEALRLESLLHLEANGLEHPAEQADCIREFAENFESPDGPRSWRGTRGRRSWTSSAFNDAARSAQETGREEVRARQRSRLSLRAHPSEALRAKLLKETFFGTKTQDAVDPRRVARWEAV